jgi:hypothetical protein
VESIERSSFTLNHCYFIFTFKENLLFKPQKNWFRQLKAKICGLTISMGQANQLIAEISLPLFF